MDDQTAYQTVDFAEVYDAIYAGREDTRFWRTMAAAAAGRPILELGCGTGRALLPVARDGHEVTGIDLSERMLDVCRAKLLREPAAVRERVRLLVADMTSFDLGRRFALVTVPFASFQHLLTVEQQLACLERCRAHLLPRGLLVLDLPNPDPAPLSAVREETAAGEATAEVVEWTAGRQIRWWATASESRRAKQIHAFTVTSTRSSPPRRSCGGSRRRCSCATCSATSSSTCWCAPASAWSPSSATTTARRFGDESPAMIVVAEPTDDGAGDEEQCA